MHLSYIQPLTVDLFKVFSVHVEGCGMVSWGCRAKQTGLQSECCSFSCVHLRGFCEPSGERMKMSPYPLIPTLTILPGLF